MWHTYIIRLFILPELMIIDPIYNIYTSNNLHKDLESAMIAYFGENEKDSIKYILHNLFYGNSFSDAKFTDDIWENLNPADYIIEAFQKRNSKKKK